MSLRDRILSANDIESHVVHVEQWNVDIEIRTVTALERARLVKGCTDENGNVDMERMAPTLIVASCFDPETGNKVFSDEDVEALQEKSSGAIDFVAQKAMEYSGLAPKAVDVEGKGN